MTTENRVIGDRFELTKEIATRSSCKVYLAKDNQLGGIDVAVKLFTEAANSSVEKLFNDELAALRNVSHQTFVPIVAGGLSDNNFYIVLEYIPGESLKDILKAKNAPYPAEESIQIISKLCEALAEMHTQSFDTAEGKKQLIHGHIDSRAVLFKGDQARLAGFHPLAIDQLQKQMTSVARVAADAGYISPEQLSGTEVLDQRTDIYALGVLLFEMVCGERPFVAANPLQAAMLRMTTSPPTPSKKNPELSPLLDATILKALSRNSSERFQSALEFRDALLGNKKVSKNPFFSEGGEKIAVVPTTTTPDRMTTETIAVSFSNAEVQAMLKAGGPTKAPAVPQAEDTSRTMTGLSTSSIMRPGLIWLSGSKKGTRISIEKSQLLLGADPSCDVILSGKQAANRQALIVEKAGTFTLIGTSSKSTEVSGKSVKIDEEHQLSKGDVIKVGENELRYLAPGEVFTLKDEGVSLKVAKGSGKSAKVLLISVLSVAILIMGGMYLWRSDIDATKAKNKVVENTTNKKIAEKVKQLVSEGDELMKKGAYISPAGENALEKFQEVLTLETDNSYAKRRLEELTERRRQLVLDEERKRQMQGKLTELLAQGELYYGQGQLVSPPGKNAKESFQEVLKIDMTNEKARARIKEIDAQLGDMLSRVSGSLARAKQLAEIGQFTQPEGDNAFALLQDIRKLDPNNKDAMILQYDMAAKSLVLGDKAKKDKQIKEVRRHYLTAQALGVDPACIEQKLKGLDLIAKSSGKVVFSGQNDECPKSTPGHLDSAELSKRIAALTLEMELKGN